MRVVGRRAVLAAGLGGLLLGCTSGDEEGDVAPTRTTREGDGDGPEDGRLRAVPVGAAEVVGARGTRTVEVGTGRPAMLHVPPAEVHAVVVALHGAGGDAAGGLAPLLPSADAEGLLLVAPASEGPTWDVIRGGYGPDVAALDELLAAVAAQVLPRFPRLAVSGFSDGASYALSLGLTNGDLFDRVVAFSPGFVAPAAQRGRPPIYVTHGVHDQVLPIDRCSRRIVPRLEAAGHEVRYVEFDGPHTVPPDLAAEAAAWLAA